MLNKIFVFLWIALIAILIIENMVNNYIALVFISNSQAWVLSLFSTIIWIFMWYWIKWMLSKDNWDDDNYDF